MTGSLRHRAALRTAVALIVACSACSVPSILYAQDSSWVLSDVRVVDVARGVVLPPRAVTIRGTRIAAISDAESPAQRTLRHVDGHGAYVIPGLVDMHVHLASEGSPSDSTLARLVHEGVLAVRDMGVPLSGLDDLARLARRPFTADAPRPRIWYVGPILNAPLTHGLPLHTPVDDSASIDAVVRRAAAAGVVGIKVHDRLSVETYRRIASAAHAQHLPIVGHLPAAVTLDDAIAARQRTVEHLGGLTHGLLMACSRDTTVRPRLVAAIRPDSFLLLVQTSMSADALRPLLDGYDAGRCAAVARRLRAADVGQVPTLVLWRYWSRSPEPLPGGTQADLAAYRRLYPVMVSMTHLLHEAGATIMTGTDGVGSMQDEMELLAATGLSPAEVLRAATIRPLAVLGAADSLGLVRPGYVADLVLLAANPLTDVRNARRVMGVVLAGRMLRRK
ncbi:MAG: amidohydrolase family protein [Gemmatirosa sp.]|nr:amidohydrolase family protein [Gemmatirosa sp.]